MGQHGKGKHALSFPCVGCSLGCVQFVALCFRATCTPFNGSGRGAASLGAAPVFADSIDDAAKKLSDAAYPFLKEVDWNSDIYTKIPGASPSQVLKAVDKAIVMGAAMDPAALKAGVLAHHKAIGSIDAKGVTSAADFEAINAALGHMIASVPTSKTMDVYNAFSGIVGKDVPSYLMSTVKADDASKTYSALMEFKDVVKAAR